MVHQALRHSVQELVDAGAPTPLGVIDLDAFDNNMRAMPQRAGGLPIRVASKSLRAVEPLKRILNYQDDHGNHPYQGILSFTLREALHLHAEGFTDLLVAYPTADHEAIRELSQNSAAADTITLMVDSVEHLDFIEQATGNNSHPIRICIDIDTASIFGVSKASFFFGARRSPLRTVEEVVALGRSVVKRKQFRLVGLMGYEGQIAGTANGGGSIRARAIRAMQQRSIDELGVRRTAIVEAMKELTDLEIINGGGTGSLESSSQEGSLNEVAAGSGFYSPGLFDRYDHFQHEPAAYYVSKVVRKPAKKWATVYGGGWIASGVPGEDRLPTVAWPKGLKYSPTEGAGEVQTPLRGKAAADLKIGDLVYFRHAKAGELAEHLNHLHVYSEGRIIDQWGTYRAKGWTP